MTDYYIYIKRILNEYGKKYIVRDTKNKKIDVYKNGEYIASIGDVRYNDYPTYILNDGKKYADERRKLYYKRHNLNSSKYSPDNLAKLILW